MSNRIFTPTAACAMLLLGLAGCAGLDVFEPKPDQTRFFVFSQSVPATADRPIDGGGPVVAVGPSGVAKYLDQPQIVTFEGANELRTSPGNRWGEPLAEGVNRLLVQQISAALGSARVGPLRVMGEFDWQYRVGYHIYQLGGPLDGPVRLQVSWWISARDGATSQFDGAVYSQPVAGDGRDHAAYVQAVEATVQAWAQEVGRRLAELAAP